MEKEKVQVVTFGNMLKKIKTKFIMKRFILSLLFVVFTAAGFCQAPPSILKWGAKYEIIDSLPIERIMVHFNKEVDSEDLIYLGDGDYMAPVPHKDRMIIKTTPDRTKAIVVYNSYAWGRHLEFNIREDDRHIILWYQNGNIYCGYVYDKEFKIAKYYESRKEYNRFIRHPRALIKRGGF